MCFNHDAESAKCLPRFSMEIQEDHCLISLLCPFLIDLARLSIVRNLKKRPFYFMDLLFFKHFIGQKYFYKFAVKRELMTTNMNFIFL